MEETTRERESGYYWVKLGGEHFPDRWEIAEYRDWATKAGSYPWYITDHGEELPESAITRVGDRIPRPKEVEISESESIKFGPQPFTSSYWITDDGVPDGGIICGPGFTISVQRGTVETNESGELVPNGVFSQTLVAVVIDLLENCYQKSKFANHYNEEAIAHLNAAQE